MIVYPVNLYLKVKMEIVFCWNVRFFLSLIQLREAIVFDVRQEWRHHKCAAFEPTKDFRNIVDDLEISDSLIICGKLLIIQLILKNFN